MSESKHRPWGINRLGDMVSPDVKTKTPDGWAWAVPVPYHKNVFEAIRAAWWVFTGKAEAVIWPEAGELEKQFGGSLIRPSDVWNFVYGEKRGSVTAEDLAAFLGRRFSPTQG